MRIGVLTTSFPRYEGDVAGSFVLGFAKSLAARGHRVDVLAPEPAATGKTASWTGVELHQVAYLRPRALQRTFYGSGVPDNLVRDPLAWLGLAPFSVALALVARSRSRRWDAVFSHWALPSALAAGWAVAERVPHVAVLHSADVHLLEQLPMGRRLAHRVASTAHALWFVSEEQRSRFTALLPERHALGRCLVCPMGIDLPTREQRSMDRASIRRRHQLHRFTVLSLGRLVPIKGLDTLIEACSGTEITLVIAGDGPQRAELARKAERAQVDARFVGIVVGDEKRDWLLAADAFALPSRRLSDGRSEGLPTALLEALSYDLPIIASRLPGIAGLLEATSPRHVLAPPDDARAWRALLRTLSTTRALQLKAAGSGLALAQRYAWPRVADKALALCEASCVLPPRT